MILINQNKLLLFTYRERPKVIEFAYGEYGKNIKWHMHFDHQKNVYAFNLVSIGLSYPFSWYRECTIEEMDESDPQQIAEGFMNQIYEQIDETIKTGEMETSDYKEYFSGWTKWKWVTVKA